jgi:hypothetical protein
MCVHQSRNDNAPATPHPAGVVCVTDSKVTPSSSDVAYVTVSIAAPHPAAVSAFCPTLFTLMANSLSGCVPHAHTVRFSLCLACAHVQILHQQNINKYVWVLVSLFSVRLQIEGKLCLFVWSVTNQRQ